VSRDAFATVF